MGNALTQETPKLSYLGVQIRRRAMRDRSRMLTNSRDTASKSNTFKLVIVLSSLPHSFIVTSPRQEPLHRSSIPPKTLRSLTCRQTTTHASLRQSSSMRLSTLSHYTPFLVCSCLTPYLRIPLSFSFPSLSSRHTKHSFYPSRPSTNAVYALALCARSRPSIRPSFPPQIEYQSFPRLHRHAGLSPATILSLFLFSFAHTLS